MDGNGRWAKKRGEERIMGHRNGVNAVRQICEACAELGVGYLTLYTFSTENWNRPKEEIGACKSNDEQSQSASYDFDFDEDDDE